MKKTKKEAISFSKSLRDGQGRGLDREMIGPVACFYMAGIETTASCIGHETRGCSYPWVDIKNPGKSDVLFLKKELPSFHLVRKGRPRFQTFRLVPLAVEDVGSDIKKDWSKEREELYLFSKNFLDN